MCALPGLASVFFNKIITLLDEKKMKKKALGVVRNSVRVAVLQKDGDAFSIVCLKGFLWVILKYIYLPLVTVSRKIFLSVGAGMLK